MKEVIKAGLKEIELATNGTLSHREITEAVGIRRKTVGTP